MVVLEVSNLGYSYDGVHTIIEDINLKFDHPGLYCIVGPNGVGKSTLIKCINRIQHPTEGAVFIDGINVGEMKQKEVAQKIGYVPTTSEDVFSMPVVDAIKIGRFNFSKNETKNDLEITYRVMKLLHIRNLANHGFKELSAGQHQKVSLARGLVQETPILMLDEPTSNLDIKFQIYVTELLRGLAISDDMIVIMISHDLNIAAKYAHEVIMMSRPGKVFCRGMPKDVITKENLKSVYDIDCEIVEIQGCPHVIPGSSMMEEDDLDIEPAKKHSLRRLFK